MTDPKTAPAPHDCTECGEPAYIPFHGNARCTNRACPRYDRLIWVEHVIALPDPGDPVTAEDMLELDWEEETEPRGYAAIGLPTLDLQSIQDALDAMPKPFFLTPKK